MRTIHLFVRLVEGHKGWKSRLASVIILSALPGVSKQLIINPSRAILTLHPSEKVSAIQLKKGVDWKTLFWESTHDAECFLKDLASCSW